MHGVHVECVLRLYLSTIADMPTICTLRSEKPAQVSFCKRSMDRSAISCCLLIAAAANKWAIFMHHLIKRQG